MTAASWKKLRFLKALKIVGDAVQRRVLRGVGADRSGRERGVAVRALEAEAPSPCELAKPRKYRLGVSRVPPPTSRTMWVRSVTPSRAQTVSKSSKTVSYQSQSRQVSRYQARGAFPGGLGQFGQFVDNGFDDTGHGPYLNGAKGRRRQLGRRRGRG